MAQSQGESPTPDPLRILTLVRELDEEFGAQQFGQIMQTLLAIAFQRAGYSIIKNTVGVPDLQAFRPSTPGGFAIEVKTGDASITLSKRDLDGVRSSERSPVVAAYFLSDPTPRWWLVDAKSLRPATYRRYEVEMMPRTDVGFDVTDIFSRVLVNGYRTALEGPGALARLLSS
jgi:hypothetical protein